MTDSMTEGKEEDSFESPQETEISLKLPSHLLPYHIECLSEHNIVIYLHYVPLSCNNNSNDHYLGGIIHI